MRTAKTGSTRKATAMLRCYPSTKVRLEMLAERWKLDFPALLERMVPGSKVVVEACRYCHKITRAPTHRHRFHEGTCALYADREPGAMA